MKLFVILLSLTTLEAASIVGVDVRLDEEAPDQREILLTETENGEYKLMNLKDSRILKSPSISDIHYYVFSRNNRNNPYRIDNNDASQLARAGFNPSKRVVFIIHGWNNDHTSSVNSLIKEALLSVADINVIVVDWGTLANKNYVTAKEAVKPIGQFVGSFINTMAANYRKSYKDVVIIGHSLGAHVSGAAGATTKQKVDYIVGLDPALPLFTLHNTDGRLDTTDADFVEVIHTSGGRLGFLSAIGHADYYPNGGEIQPGCGADVTAKCAHSRSYIYFADSIKDRTREFLAYKCDSYSHYKNGNCKTEKSPMGDFNVNKNARGTYYLQTRSQEPFAEDNIPH